MFKLNFHRNFNVVVPVLIRNFIFSPVIQVGNEFWRRKWYPHLQNSVSPLPSQKNPYGSHSSSPCFLISYIYTPVYHGATAAPKRSVSTQRQDRFGSNRSLLGNVSVDTYSALDRLWNECFFSDGQTSSLIAEAVGFCWWEKIRSQKV